MRTRSDDGGQAVPLLAAMVVVGALAVAGFGVLGARAAEAARARTAADAAALAGIVDGEAAARRLAALNGATLESFAIVGADVIVQVRVGAARVRARATLSLDPPP